MHESSHEQHSKIWCHVSRENLLGIIVNVSVKGEGGGAGEGRLVYLVNKTFIGGYGTLISAVLPWQSLIHCPHLGVLSHT